VRKTRERTRTSVYFTLGQYFVISHAAMDCALNASREPNMAIEEKPSRNEAEYFARLDAELMKERRARLDSERLSQERSSHHNKCPKCGCDLTEREHNHVKVDECAECGGVWLDKGELKMIEDFDRSGSGFLGSLLGFRR
jgi:hypothetical protein